ncbi:MmpS family transport accessory protein [Micromonospora sp. B11E3]|uniref:MmpS family transport accessory protein n=1 Tax=Micromonospora sp. B11E3 TaxID=3153562 RepID=UPI00325EAF2B
MSEASSSPEPAPSSGSSPEPTPSGGSEPAGPSGWPDPTGPSTPEPPGPAGSPWSPPDPLAPPQAWTAPDPWVAPAPWYPPPAPTGTEPPAAGPVPPPPAGAPWPGYVRPGWPPAGYPPPYAYPGRPPARSGSDRTVVGLVITLVVVLVVGLCGCACVAGALVGLGEDRAASEEPWYDDPYDDGRYHEDGTPSPDPTTFAADPTKKPITRPTSGPAPVTVVYEVTGAGRADIAYFDAESDLIHVDGAKLPWRTTIRTDGKSRVMVEATWSGDENGPLTCRLTVTGAGKPVIKVQQGYWNTACRPE